MLPLNQVRIEMSYLSHSEGIERTPLLDYCRFLVYYSSIVTFVAVTRVLERIATVSGAVR